MSESRSTVLNIMDDYTQETWLKAYSMLPMADRLARRFVRSGDPQAREELVNTIGLDALAYAIHTHDPLHSRLRTWCTRVISHAYAREIAKRVRIAEYLAPDGVPDDKESIVPRSKEDAASGLEAREELYTILEAAGVDPFGPEALLLLARYGDDVPLRTLADRLGVASPQTVVNRISKLIERCREHVYPRDGSPPSE